MSGFLGPFLFNKYFIFNRKKLAWDILCWSRFAANSAGMEFVNVQLYFINFLIFLDFYL